MKRWLGAPALHFLAIGAVIFALQSSGTEPAADDHGRVREPIVIPAARVAQIRDSYERQTGLAASDEDEAKLLASFVDDELLYREALAHGLDKYDRSVRFRMVTKMRFLEADHDEEESGDDAALYEQALELGLDHEDVVIKRILIHKMRLLIRLAADNDNPTSEETESFFRDHADEYMQPGRVTFTHVYLSAGKRGDALENDAAALLEELRADDVAATDAVRRGDAFTLGHAYRSKSPAGVEKIFGDRFREQLFAVEPQRWSGPIRSPYGLHLVFVDAQEGEKLPEFASVERQVLRRLVSERRDAHFEQTLERLRDEYEVRIGGPGAGQDGQVATEAGS